MAGTQTTQTLSERIVGAILERPTKELPDEVLREAVGRIVDTVGVGLAGAHTPAADAAAHAVHGDLGQRGVPVWGRGTRAPARTAVFVNGTAAHALDYDDSLLAAVMHSGALIVPVALAVGEEAGATGHDVLGAIACGYQVADILGRAAPAQFQAHGFQAAPVLGVFAGVVIAARLRGLDADTTVEAFGLAGSMASGLMEFASGGGDTKPLHLGWAAQSALAAVDLAVAGARGPRTVLEGTYGVFRSFAGATVPSDIEVWPDYAIQRVATKPYPVCHGIHDPADLWSDMVRQFRSRGLDPVADVERITCMVGNFTAHLTLDPLDVKRRPTTVHEARFSMPYCLARIVLDGSLGLRSFDNSRLDDPVAVSFMDKVDFEVSRADSDRERARSGLRVTLRDGEVVERFIERTRDARRDIVGPDELRSKFLDAAHAYGDRDQLDELLAAATGIHQANDLARFLTLLASVVRPPQQVT